MNEMLGGRIKALRSAKNFTQEQVADQIGVSRQKYARIESGINSVTLDILSKVAEKKLREAIKNHYEEYPYWVKIQLEFLI